MVALFRLVLAVLAVGGFTSACSPSPPAAAVPASPAGQLVSLPESASPEQVVSNLLQNVLFLDGKPMVAQGIVMVDHQGAVLAQHSLHGRKVKSYTIRNVLWVIYDHGAELCADLDTDLGRKSVYMAYEPAHEHLLGGWRCRVEAIEPVTFSTATNRAAGEGP